MRFLGLSKKDVLYSADPSELPVLLQTFSFHHRSKKKSGVYLPNKERFLSSELFVAQADLNIGYRVGKRCSMCFKAALWSCPCENNRYYKWSYFNWLYCTTHAPCCALPIRQRRSSKSTFWSDMNFFEFFSDIPTLMCSLCESLRLTASLYAKLFFLPVSRARPEVSYKWPQDDSS